MTNDKKTILIVDDEEITVDMIAEVLSLDYIVKVAYSGQQAIDILNSKEKINLILLDITIPDINGFEIAKYIKENDTTKDIPFIFLTGYSEEDSIKEGLQLGAKGYISKPIDLDELSLTLKSKVL